MASHRSQIIAAIARLIGPAVLLPVKPGSKIPLIPGWQNVRLPHAQQPEYLGQFDQPCNVGVVLGHPSNGLCSIDIDNDDDVAHFLALNPHLTVTLRTVGQRGCNLWVRIKGDYRPLTKIYHRTRVDQQGNPAAIGEWRSDGGQTIIYGQHPCGRRYKRLIKTPPMEIEFGAINWPTDWRLPWIKTEEELFIERHGPSFSPGARGQPQLNHAYVVAKFAVDHDVLWEPTEKEFYLYNSQRGLWQRTTEDALKTMFLDDLLAFALRTNVPAVMTARKNHTLNALVDLLRGRAEKTGAFATRKRGLVHLANGMLDLTVQPPLLLEFSKEFYSRNQCPITLGKGAACPEFEQRLLQSALDQDDIGLLQRWCGAALLGDNFAQKMMLLTGTSAGGKSTLVEVLTQIIGPDNIIELRPPLLNERFEIGRFLGKTLLSGKDVPGDFLGTPGAAALKKLVGHDTLTGEKKMSNGIFPLKGTFDAVITSNSRLRVHLDGDAEAWRRRLLIIPYTKPKPDQPIRDFAGVLIREEAPGILNWMLRGAVAHLAELADCGDFVLTQQQKDRIDDLLCESDSVRQFVLKKVHKDPDADVTSAHLLAGYNTFCEDKGWQPLPSRIVGRQMPDLIMEIHRAAHRNDIQRDGKPQRGYRGVGYAG